MKKIISLVLALTLLVATFSLTIVSANAEGLNIQKVDGIMDSLTFADPVAEEDVEGLVADFIADKHSLEIYYDYDSESGKYYYYCKENTNVYFDSVDSLEKLARERMQGFDIYVLNGTCTTVSVPSGLKATLAKSFNEAEKLLKPISTELSMLQVYQIMLNSGIEMETEDYYITCAAYGKNDDGTINAYDVYQCQGPWTPKLSEMEIDFDGEVPEYLLVIYTPSGISAWIIVAICVVVLAGVYFALGFTLYKKGKLTGKFFETIYKWIKK